MTHRETPLAPGRAAKLGPAAVLFAALSWSTTGLALALLPAGVAPPAVAAVRLLGGGALLMAAGLSPRRLRGIAQRQHAGPVAICIVSMAAYQALYLSAFRDAGVAIATIVGISAIPVCVGVLAIIRQRALPHRGWLIATPLAVAGSAVLVLSGSGSGHAASTVGILEAIGSGCAYAVFTTTCSAHIRRGAEPKLIMSATLVGAGIVLSPTLMATSLAWMVTGTGIAVAGYIVLIPTTLAYISCGHGMKTVPATTVSTLFLAEPASAAVIGIAVLHEPATSRTYLGLGLVVAALLVLTLIRPDRDADGDDDTSGGDSAGGTESVDVVARAGSSLVSTAPAAPVLSGHRRKSFEGRSRVG
jgi:drug/metabolite transporter, DME family